MKKAIIFDCDNTLWKGVVGEGPIECDMEIQRDIIFLANKGVIIGLCSKNNEDDVMKAIETQPLTEKYISVKRINWNDKVSNLKEIAQELNIGLDAIVFVDDSDFERGLVREMLPEVMAIHPKHLMGMALDNFDLSGDISKTQQYKENLQRLRYQKEFTNIDDYLKSLDMVLTIKLNDESQIARIAELTQKTNQFNLTNQRCIKEDIRVYMTTGSVYSLSVKDRFGDNGLTGVAIVHECAIIVFLLSCRILGRGIEDAFLDHIIKDQTEKRNLWLCAKYHRSLKNVQTEDFYLNAGFKIFLKHSNASLYEIDLIDYKPKAKPHFRYE